MLFDYILWFCLAFLGLMVASLRLIYFAQLKEYRYDRLKDFFIYDKGARMIFRPILVVAFFLLLIGLIWADQYRFVVLVYLLSQITAGVLYGFYRFKATVKALFIFIVSLTLNFIVALNVSVLAALLLSPIILVLTVAVSNAIFNIQKKRIIQAAKVKLEKYKKLKIIGVTGSYGKSSIKDFISAILESKYNVVKTPENINTDIGIAQFILKNNFKKVDFFVAEMGAYRIGEIAKICQMAPPDFALISAIGQEHISLFGSKKNIKIAKSEILKFAKPKAKLFSNADDPGSKNLKFKTITFGSNKSADYKAENIVTNQEGMVEFQYDSSQISTCITGEHQAVNLMAAIAVASNAGMDTKDILKVIPKIKTRSRTLTIKKGRNNCSVLDDSYNSNLAGFLSAIKSAKAFKAKRKILITMGMMELGVLQEASHKEVAANAEKVFDKIFITRQEVFRFFGKKAKLLESSAELIKELDSLKLGKDDLILIQNKLYGPVYEYILEL